MSDLPDILEVSHANGVQTWRMAFAPANALSPELLDILDRQLTQAEEDPSVAAIVLTSGLRLFSAGGDAGWMARIHAEKGADGLVDEFNRLMDRFRQLCARLRKSPLLVIAALNGHTLAGGLELAAACDMRFCAENEKLQIGVPEFDLFGAMPAGGGGATFLTRILGPQKALRFMIDAKPVAPGGALAMGLVDELVPAAELVGRAEGYAAEIVAKAGRIGIAAAKRIVLDGAEMPLVQALDFERAVHWDCMRRGNFKVNAIDFIKRYGS